MDGDTNNILSIMAIVISILTTIVGALNHKRIRSTCCKSEVTASLDIENTTPPKIDIPK